jgi:hypothetical protein
MREIMLKCLEALSWTLSKMAYNVIQIYVVLTQNLIKWKKVKI